MRMLLATVIDFESLGKTALAALLAGTVVTFAFSLAILGTTRATELRQEGRRGPAALALSLGVVALLVSAAAVGIGLVVMING